MVVLLAMGATMWVVASGRSSETVWVAVGHARVGGQARGFTSWDLGGRKVSLSDFTGRPVLLSFWATWCTVCKDELPALQRLQSTYRSGGLAVVAVNYRESSTTRMSQYLAGLHVNLQSVVDPDGSIASAYGVDIGLPVNILLDRSSTVVRVMIGEVPTASIEDAVKQAVAAPVPQ